MYLILIETGETEMTKCSKCDGKGNIQGFEHIERGICFKCLGTGAQMSRRERLALQQANRQRAVENQKKEEAA